MCPGMLARIVGLCLHPAGRPVSAETSIHVPGPQTSRRVLLLSAGGAERRFQELPSILAGSIAATMSRRIGSVSASFLTETEEYLQRTRRSTRSRAVSLDCRPSGMYRIHLLLGWSIDPRCCPVPEPARLLQQLLPGLAMSLRGP